MVLEMDVDGCLKLQPKDEYIKAKLPLVRFSGSSGGRTILSPHINSHWWLLSSSLLCHHRDDINFQCSKLRWCGILFINLIFTSSWLSPQLNNDHLHHRHHSLFVIITTSVYFEMFDITLMLNICRIVHHHHIIIRILVNNDKIRHWQEYEWVSFPR